MKNLNLIRGQQLLITLALFGLCVCPAFADITYTFTPGPDGGTRLSSEGGILLGMNTSSDGQTGGISNIVNVNSVGLNNFAFNDYDTGVVNRPSAGTSFTMVESSIDLEFVNDLVSFDIASQVLLDHSAPDFYGMIASPTSQFNFTFITIGFDLPSKIVLNELSIDSPDPFSNFTDTGTAVWTNGFSTFTIEITDVLGPILGDINMDGAINLLDVDPFIALLANGTFQTEADINKDGAVNLLDVNPFIALLAGE